MSARTALAVSVKDTVSKRSGKNIAKNYVQETKGKQIVKSNPSQISTASNASQLNGQKPMFNNMTKSVVSKPFIEKRSGLQDIDTGIFYQMYYGNRNSSNPQIPNPTNSQVFQQNHSQMQSDTQQQNAVPIPQQLQNQQIMPPHQMNQNQITPQQMSQHQMLNSQMMQNHQVPQPQMLQQLVPQQQILQQQISQQQILQHQIPPQQILQQSVPQQQIMQQQMSQESHCQPTLQPIQTSQSDGPDTSNHACCRPENITEQQQKQLQEQYKQQQLQQVPMQYQMTTQQLMQQPQTPQMVDTSLDGTCTYQETCPNCAATFLCSLNPAIMQQVK